MAIGGDDLVTRRRAPIVEAIGVFAALVCVILRALAIEEKFEICTAIEEGIILVRESETRAFGDELVGQTRAAVEGPAGNREGVRAIKESQTAQFRAAAEGLIAEAREAARKTDGF